MSRVPFQTEKYLVMAIRVPLSRAKGLTERCVERLISERIRGEFKSLADFYRRVAPTREELEAMLRVGAFDEFGWSRTALFWEIQQLANAYDDSSASGQGWLLPAPTTTRLPATSLQEPTKQQRLEWEADLLGFVVSDHPLALYPEVAWDSYCPVVRLGEFIGQQVIVCGLIIEQRTHQQINGDRPTHYFNAGGVVFQNGDDVWGLAHLRVLR